MHLRARRYHKKQKRVFVFKLFLCNPFARSAGIFYALLCQLSSLTCLRAFTRFYALLRAFISVKQFISLLRLQFTPLTI